ncbi:MAG: DUF4254 domain-containing protein [Deltaproteobacteria bacterium]|nr:DUF4254 domain-containing protein [Deltaproteobacteria bacterium]
MENLYKINQLQIELVMCWHHQTPQVKLNGFLGLVENQHMQNFLLWHEEDIARAPDVNDQEIARVKRCIDRFNQLRNDLIEKIDEEILKFLHEGGISSNPNCALNSETPGSMIDRCSIMALKIYHMKEQVQRKDVDEQHLADSSEKVRILEIQRNDLFGCLYQLIKDVSEGRRRFMLYRQYKMYNDPTLNPKIYQAGIRQ